MNTAGPALVVALVLLCASIGATGGAVAGPADGGVDVRSAGDSIDRSAAPSPGSLALQSDDGEESNETPRHRNPDEYDEDGDLEGVESWLSDRMASRLQESSIQLSQGEYDLAREYVGEEYRERYGQYVDVAGETRGESAEDAFDEAGQEQERLANDVEEYREKRSEYESARDAGDEERARELARDLVALGKSIDESSATARSHYDDIESTTGADLSEADAAIEETNDEIQEDVASVREREFLETELVVEAEREAISFTEPLVATGALRTANGTPIADEEIRLAVAGETRQVETDDEGRFDLTYRPTDLPLSTAAIDVRFVPDARSSYLGSETSVPASVEQVEPAMTDLDVPDEIAYGERVDVGGTMTVEGVAVDDVPLDVVLGGQRVGTVRVSEGSFETAIDVPAAVPDGEREFGVRLSYEERALAGVVETERVTVRETATALSAGGERVGAREILVQGALETVDGVGVGDESVQLRVEGTTLETVRTTADGEFEERVTVPDGVEYGNLTIEAAYQGSGSNLAPASAETVVGFEPMGENGEAVADGYGIVSTRTLVGLAFVALLAGIVWWSRRGAGDRSAPSATAEDLDIEGETVDSGGTARSPFAAASEQLANGRPESAVRICYATVRRELASRQGSDRTLTHWEFYRQSCADLAEDAIELLRDVTESYERAAFSREETSESEAETVLERARRLCGVESSDRTAVADD